MQPAGPGEQLRLKVRRVHTDSDLPDMQHRLFIGGSSPTPEHVGYDYGGRPRDTSVAVDQHAAAINQRVIYEAAGRLEVRSEAAATGAQGTQ